MRTTRRRAHGFIDNRPVFVIVLIIGAIGACQFLKMKGIDPGDLWAQLPPVWRSLFWSVLGFVFLGGVAAAATVTGDERREPYRIEQRGERREIIDTALALRVICALLVLFGLMLAGFAMAGSGWFSWVVLIVGIFIGLSGATAFGPGRRFVVERGRVVLDPAPAADASGPGRSQPQLIQVRSSRSGGAFGQPLVEHHVVLVDDREILDTPTLEKADKLAAALKQAIKETRRSA